jgi:hypothetical protein
MINESAFSRSELRRPCFTDLSDRVRIAFHVHSALVRFLARCGLRIIAVVLHRVKFSSRVASTCSWQLNVPKVFLALERGSDGGVAHEGGGLQCGSEVGDANPFDWRCVTLSKAVEGADC